MHLVDSKSVAPTPGYTYVVEPVLSATVYNFAFK